MKANNVETTDLRKAALSLVLMMGIVSLFSDMTHEGAKSIYGDFLSLAGASAAVIGFVSGLGAQESVLKAAVAALVPKENRSSGYGLFETSFGLFWFLGSWLMGVLYGYSLPAMVTVSVVAQSIAIVCLLFLRKK